MDKAEVIVSPPDPDGRRVSIRGVYVGLAGSVEDVLEFLRRAGLDPDTVQLDDPQTVEWRGGGSDVWT